MKFIPLRQLIKSKVKGNEALEFLVDNIKDEFIADSIEEFLEKAIKKEKTPQTRQELKTEADKLLAANPEKPSKKIVAANQDGPIPTDDKYAAPTEKRNPQVKQKQATEIKTNEIKVKQPAVATPKVEATPKATTKVKQEKPAKEPKTDTTTFNHYDNLHPDAQKTIDKTYESVVRNLTGTKDKQHGYSKGQMGAFAKAAKEHGLDTNDAFHKSFKNALEHSIYTTMHKTHQLNDAITNGDSDHIGIAQKELDGSAKRLMKKLYILDALGGFDTSKKTNPFHFKSALGGKDPEAVLKEIMHGSDGSLYSYKGNPLSGAHTPYASQEDWDKEHSGRFEGSPTHRMPADRFSNNLENFFTTVKNTKTNPEHKANVLNQVMGQMKDPIRDYGVYGANHPDKKVLREMADPHLVTLKEDFKHINDHKAETEKHLMDIAQNDPQRFQYIADLAAKNPGSTLNKVLKGIAPATYGQKDTSKTGRTPSLVPKETKEGGIKLKPLSAKELRDHKERRGIISNINRNEAYDEGSKKILENLVSLQPTKPQEITSQIATKAKENNIDLLKDINVATAEANVPTIFSQNEDDIIKRIAEPLVNAKDQSKWATPETLTQIGKGINGLIEEYADQDHKKMTEEYKGLRTKDQFKRNEYKKHFSQFMTDALTDKHIPALLNAIFPENKFDPEQVFSTIDQIKDKNIKQMFSDTYSSMIGQTPDQAMAQGDVSPEASLGEEFISPDAAKTAGSGIQKLKPMSGTDESNLYVDHAVRNADKSLSVMKNLFKDDPEISKIIPDNISSKVKPATATPTEETPKVSMWDKIKSKVNEIGSKRAQNLMNSNQKMIDSAKVRLMSLGDNIKIFPGTANEATVSYTDLPPEVQETLPQKLINNFGRDGWFSKIKGKAPEEQIKIYNGYFKNAIRKEMERLNSDFNNRFTDSGAAKWSRFATNDQVKGLIDEISKTKDPEQINKLKGNLKEIILHQNASQKPKETK